MILATSTIFKAIFPKQDKIRKLRSHGITFSCTALTSFFLAWNSTASGIPPGVQKCVIPAHSDDLSRRSHLDPARPLYVNLGPYSYAVPWKYLHPRPTQIWANCLIDTKVLGMQFWIPDGRAPERDLFWNGNFNPTETSHSDPTPSDWVIKVTAISFYDQTPPSDVNPDKGINNLLKLHKSPKLESFEGLTGIASTFPSVETRHWYSKSSNESLLFFCLGPLSTSVCQGYLDLKDKHLAVHFITAGSAVRFHGAIVSVLRSLLDHWSLK